MTIIYAALQYSKNKNTLHFQPLEALRLISHQFNMSETGEYSPEVDYKSRTGQSEVPVQADDAPVEDPIDAETADSDETLGMFMRCSISF